MSTYCVVRFGGSVGSKPTFISVCKSKESAKDYAKRLRSQLSKGEKSYYGMTYKTMTLDQVKKAIPAISNIPEGL